MAASPELRSFRRRRRAGLWLGVFVPACGLGTAVINRKLQFLPPVVAWTIAAAGLALGFLVFNTYRCPYCGRCPEEDMPNFDPKSCDHCGAALR